MDFYAMKRKQLQELCKKHGVPANMKNVEMADKLTSILKGKENPKFKGKSCLKPLIDDLSDRSDKLARNVKKVKFSPENETFEFLHSENDVDLRAKRTKSRALRKFSIMKVDQEVKNKVKVELSDQVTNAGLKMTRSLAQKSVVAEAAVNISSPPVQKRMRKNYKSKYIDVADVVEMDSSIDCSAAGVEQGRGSLDENLAEKGEKLETGKVVRRSTRNVTKDKHSAQLNVESGGDADTTFEFEGRNKIVQEVLVNKEHEVILQPNGAKGRKSSRRKMAVIFNGTEKKLGESVEDGPITEEHIKVPKENGWDSQPGCNLRQSRRKTTLFKSNASVNVGLETNENLGEIKALKQSSKLRSCEQASKNLELPRCATRNSSKHDSSAVSNEVTVVVNQKRNYTRKQRKIEPVPQKEALVTENVRVQGTITAGQTISLPMAIESELNTTDNSAIIVSLTKLGTDSEHQGVTANLTCFSEHVAAIESAPQEINVDIIEQSIALDDSGKFGSGGEQSSGYVTQVPNDIICEDKMFNADEDGINSQERSVIDVKLNGDETDQTRDLNILTETVCIKLGCEAETLGMNSGYQIVDCSDNVGLEKVIDNVSEEVTKQNMNEVSCGDGSNTSMAVTASGISEDITSSVNSRSTDNEHKENADLVGSELNISVTGTSSIEQREVTDCITEMMVKTMSIGEDISAIVGSPGQGKSQDTLDQEDIRLITQIERTSLIIDTNSTNNRSIEEMLYSSEEYVHSERKEVEVLETNLSSFKHELLLTVHHVNEQEVDEVEVPASDTYSFERVAVSFCETICQDLDDSTYEGIHKEDNDAEERTNSKENPLHSEFGHDIVNEAVEMSLSQATSKSSPHEKIISLNSPEGFSLKLYDQEEDFVERCSGDGGIEAITRNYDATYEGNEKDEGMHGVCTTELCYELVKERNASLCLEAELVCDGDFHNAVAAQANGSASSYSKGTNSKVKKETEEKTSIEMIQHTSPCIKTINMGKEEETSGTLDKTSPFRNCDVTYDDKDKDECRMVDLATELCNDIVKERSTSVCLEAELCIDGDFYNVVAEINGNVLSNSEHVICERTNEPEKRTTSEMIQNVSPSIMINDMNKEEVSFGTSQPLGKEPDLLVSDYGHEYANMYILNGSSATSDTLIGETTHDSVGDNVKEKSDLVVVESISIGTESTDLVMDTENDTMQQHDEIISIDLADKGDLVQETEEINSFASNELMLAYGEVEGNKETIRTLEREFDFGAENAVAGAVEFYAHAQSNEMDADHFKEIEVAEVHEISNDDSIYETAENNVEEKAIVTTPTLRKIDTEMDVEISNLVVQSIFERNGTSHLLLDSEKLTVHQCDEFRYIDHEDNTDQDEDQRCSLASNELMPIYREVEGREDTFKTLEGELDVGDEKNASIATELDGLTQNNERDADNHIEEVKFAEIHPSYQDDHTFEKSKNIENEAEMVIVKEEDIVDAFCSDLELGKSNSTAASSLTGCKISIDVKTAFKGDYEVTFESSCIQVQKKELNNEANFGSNEEDSKRNSPTDHLSLIKEGDLILLESEEKATAKETNEETHVSSSIIKGINESLEIAIDTQSFPVSPVTSFTTRENGVLELQVQSSNLFSSRETSLFLEECEGDEVKALSPSKDLHPTTMGNDSEEQLHQHSHNVEEKVTKLSGTDLAALDQVMFEQVETLQNNAVIATKACSDCEDDIEQTVAINMFNHSALGEPVFEEVESVKENMKKTAAVENSFDYSTLVESVFEQAESLAENVAVISTEECFDGNDNMEHTIAIENSFDHFTLNASVFEQFESLKENVVIATGNYVGFKDSMEQIVAIQNSVDHAASDEVIAESVCMDSKIQIVTTDVLKYGANCELTSKEIDSTCTEGSNYISNHGAELKGAIISSSAKQLSSPTELKEIRSKPKQRTPEKMVVWASDMKENTAMIKTDQTILKSVTKRRALENIQK